MIIHRSLFVALTLISSATHTMNKLVRLNIPRGIAHHSMRYSQPMRKTLQVTPRFCTGPKCVNTPLPTNDDNANQKLVQAKKDAERLYNIIVYKEGELETFECNYRGRHAGLRDAEVHSWALLIFSATSGLFGIIPAPATASLVTLGASTITAIRVFRQSQRTTLASLQQQLGKAMETRNNLILAARDKATSSSSKKLEAL